MPNLIFVYGTLKENCGNDRWFLSKSKKVKEAIVKGYKLKDSGFPAALPCQNTAIRGEVWELPENERDRVAELAGLDRLEGHPHFYERTPVVTEDGDNVQMYVGKSQRFFTLEDCPMDENGVYTWGR